jgi:hypothetical protein
VIVLSECVARRQQAQVAQLLRCGGSGGATNFSSPVFSSAAMSGAPASGQSSLEYAAPHLVTRGVFLAHSWAQTRPNRTQIGRFVGFGEVP